MDQTGIYVSAHTTENIETCMLKMSPDGKERLWTALHARPWDGALSLAVDGGEVFMLGHVKTTDDRIAPLQRRKQLLFVYDAETGRLAKRTVAGTAVGEQPVMIDVQWDPANDDMDASDMDAYAGALVVAYEKRNALRWYDPQAGALLDTAAVPAPAGVAVGADGAVFVSTGDRVVKLSRANKAPTDVVTSLDKPGRLDVDHSSGDLFVYEAGTRQIKRFSAAGALRTTYGAKGGRQDGLYDDAAKHSFAGFADLCADGTGGFYVTEASAAPRRTAHFAADGSVVREWYGGQRWAPHAALEGDNPNVMWVGSQYGWVMRVLVDHERKSWTVHSCYRYTGLADGLVGDSWNEGGYFHVYKHRDGLYVGGLMDHADLNGIEKHWYQCGGEFCHASVATLPDGDVLFFGNWENEVRVYRVSGWNGWQRQSGKIRITTPAAAHTGQGLTAVTFEDAALTKPRGVAVAAGIDVSWSKKKPAPGGIRWTGSLLPEYGPAYKGPWTAQADKEAFDGTSHGARDNGASVAFRFRGASIRVVGKTGPNGGFADIALDGQPQPQFDCYSPEGKRDAVLFSKEGLPEGDHEVTVTVVGWHGKPRNKASSDAWVHVDKFVVDGREYDDAGLPHTFTAHADGKVGLWLKRSHVFGQAEARSAREEIQGQPIKLLRQQTPIQLNYTDATADGGIVLQWSSPFLPKQPIPTACLYPITPGGYTVDNLRHLGDLPRESGAK